MNNVLVKTIGWIATVLHGDPTVFDRWRWIRRHLLPGPLRTLDAGSGSGAFTMYASRIGNESVGLSFDEKKNHIARKRAKILGITNIEFIQVDLRELDVLRLGKFDQIICSETIEHIINDKKLVADLSKCLKPAGRLLLTTPYKHYRRLLGDRLSNSEDGAHVRWGYTHQEIRQLFLDSGLHVQEEAFISGIVSCQLTNLMRLLARVNGRFAWLVTFPLRIFRFLDSPLTQLINYPHLSIGVVGIKQE